MEQPHSKLTYSEHDLNQLDLQMRSRIISDLKDWDTKKWSISEFSEYRDENPEDPDEGPSIEKTQIGSIQGPIDLLEEINERRQTRTSHEDNERGDHRAGH